MSLAMLIGKELGAFALKKIMHKEKEVEVTEKQEKVILSPDVGNDLTDMLVKYLPDKLKDDIDDKAKDTVKTCDIAIEALEEIVTILKSVKSQAENIEKKL